jgi:hypothetical protein
MVKKLVARVAGVIGLVCGHDSRFTGSVVQGQKSCTDGEVSNGRYPEHSTFAVLILNLAIVIEQDHVRHSQSKADHVLENEAYMHEKEKQGGSVVSTQVTSMRVCLSMNTFSCKFNVHFRSKVLSPLLPLKVFISSFQDFVSAHLCSAKGFLVASRDSAHRPAWDAKEWLLVFMKATLPSA